MICLLFIGKRLPFDWKTPYGFLVTVSTQAASCFCVIYDVAPHVGFMFGSCILIIAFIEDIANEFTALAAPSKSLARRHMQMKKRLFNIIKLYSNVKQLSISRTNFDH